MTSEPVNVSVLIPVLNEEANLRAAAAAMLSQSFDGRLEFLFIDGGSRDASLEILSALAAADRRVRVLANPARRTPQALNIGLRDARGEYVARMDAHAIYPPRYLSDGVARLRRGGVAWVSGPQLPVGTSPGSERIARALAAPFGRGGAAFREALGRERVVDTGFTGIWRRELLLSHGGWNEEWINDQDVELAARIRRAGGTIVCVPEMAAQYVPRSTLRSLARQYMTYGTYRVKTSRRHPETLKRSQLLPPGVALAGVGSILAPTRPMRRLARAGIAIYTVGLLVSGVRAAEPGRRDDWVGLPVVWATMHLGYGVGFLRGSARFGPPVGAVGRVLTEILGRATVAGTGGGGRR